MMKSDELQIKISEAESRKDEAQRRLNDAVEKRNALGNNAPTAELLSEMDNATKELRAANVLIAPLRIEHRAVKTQEAEQAGKPKDSEARERDKLIGETSIMDYLDECLSGTKATGKAHEARQALLGDEARERMIPFEFLLPPDDGPELRADTVTPVGASVKVANYQASVLERVFTRSIARRLLVSMPSVPVGQANFPILTGGTTAAMVAEDAQHDAGAGAFTGFTLEPKRLTAAVPDASRGYLQAPGIRAGSTARSHGGHVRCDGQPDRQR